MIRNAFVIITSIGFILFAAAPQSRGGDYQGKVNFSVDDLVIEKRFGFDCVRYKDAGSGSTVGAPSLPNIQVHVAIPPGATVSRVSTLGNESIEIDGRFDVMPVAEPCVCGTTPVQNPFEKDPAFYNRDSFYPGNHAGLLGSWELVGQGFVVVELYPVQYNPIEQKLCLATRIDFEVSYTEAHNHSRTTYNFSPVMRIDYMERLKGAAINPEDVKELPSYTPQLSSSLDPAQYEYVIITTSSFASEFEDLKQWRTQKGLPATIVDLGWIYSNYTGGSNQEQIRNFVIDAHSTWGSVYFLLGGDTAYVPYHVRSINGDNIPNDTYYADYDDDWVYEVYVGRACVQSPSEIGNFIDKVLTYEKTPHSDYGDKAFFMGFDLDTHTHAEQCKETIKNTWMPAHIEYSWEYDSEPGGHESDVKDYINQGQNMVNHCDHANTSILGVGSGYLDNSEAQQFTNGTKYSNFYTIGCYAGNYPSTCWGECFVNDDQGGITFVGNSRYGWYSPGSTDSLSMLYDMKYWQIVLKGYVYRVGRVLADSLSNWYPSSGTYCYIHTELNLFGDPALQILTDDPGDMTVIHDSTIDTGYQNFTINVQSGGENLKHALACVMKDGEVYEYGITHLKGMVTFAIDPVTPGTMTLTVTAKNHRYYEQSITVNQSSSPPPTVESIAPRCGVEAGGTPVTITGSNITINPLMEAFVGGVDCLDVTVISPTQLTCVVPAGTDGWYDVELSNSYGSDTLDDGFRYFPVGGDPFNAADIHTESIDTPAEAVLIISGIPGKTYALFFSYGGGPETTGWGTMGLDIPFYQLFVASIPAEGCVLIPLTFPAGYGPLDFYMHSLGTNSLDNILWAYGGNNQNGSGSVWFHLNN